MSHWPECSEVAVSSSMYTVKGGLGQPWACPSGVPAFMPEFPQTLATPGPAAIISDYIAPHSMATGHICELYEHMQHKHELSHCNCVFTVQKPHCSATTETNRSLLHRQQAGGCSQPSLPYSLSVPMAAPPTSQSRFATLAVLVGPPL